MSRPKGSPGKPTARQRIVTAWWELLAQCPLRDLTVCDVVARASCNRATFYYHFQDLDALANEVIERLLLADRSLVDLLARLATQPRISDQSPEDRVALARLREIIDRIGMEPVRERTLAVALRAWKAALRPDGSELSHETRCILEFAVNGLFGALIVGAGQASADAEATDMRFISEFLQRNAAFVLEQISVAESVSQETAATRLSFIARSAQDAP